jgi:microsomal dipeptidase-like Zn-dependent dipeptidase
MGEHWETFIGLLSQPGFTDGEIAMIVGDNLLRVMRAVLPEA